MIIREEINLSIQFEDEIDISELNLIMAAHQRLMQRAYLAYQGQPRITQVPKNRFRASVGSVENGSINFRFVVKLIETARELFPTDMEGIVDPVSNVMKYVILFLKKRAELYRKHKAMPTVQMAKNARGNIISPVQVSGNNHNIIISPTIKLGADIMEEPTVQLVRAARKKELKIHCVNGNSKTDIFSISDRDLGILDVVALRDMEAEEMSVKIFKFNKISGKGMLVIMESKTMESETVCNFSASRKDVRYDNIVDAMHDSVDKSEIKVIKNFVYQPSGERTIKSLNIKYIK